MKQLTEITSEAKQEYIVQVSTGELFTFRIEYLHRIAAWVCNIIYKDITINGIRIAKSPNILSQYVNLLPFGIACNSTYKVDPFDLTNFSEGLHKLYILTASEVVELNTILSK